jgi:hypothetical protein
LAVHAPDGGGGGGRVLACNQQTIYPVPKTGFPLNSRWQINWWSHLTNGSERKLVHIFIKPCRINVEIKKRIPY